MTLKDIRDDGLQWFGDDGATGSPESFLLSWIAQEINAALQKIYTDGPRWVRLRHSGLLLPGPSTLSGKAINQYATQFTADTGGAITTAMEGSSIYIQGSTQWNTILAADSSGVGATLRDPFMGPSVTGATATIVGDTIKLPNYFGLTDVHIHPADDEYHRDSKLTPFTSFAEYQEVAYYENDVANQEPERYLIEYHNNDVILRVWPFPDGPYLLKLQGEAIPARYAVADLSSEVISPDLPSGMVETVFLPIFRYGLTRFPHFNNDDVVPRLREDYERAMLQLEHMEPQKARCTQTVPGL